VEELGIAQLMIVNARMDLTGMVPSASTALTAKIGMDIAAFHVQVGKCGVQPRFPACANQDISGMEPTALFFAHQVKSMSMVFANAPLELI
jgi:hypothetical protein